MERQTPDEKIAADMLAAQENGVHIDVVVNPFIGEEERPAIISGNTQDPEWD